MQILQAVQGGQQCDGFKNWCFLKMDCDAGIIDRNMIFLSINNTFTNLKKINFCFIRINAWKIGHPRSSPKIEVRFSRNNFSRTFATIKTAILDRIQKSKRDSTRNYTCFRVTLYCEFSYNPFFLRNIFVRKTHVSGLYRLNIWQSSSSYFLTLPAGSAITTHV